MTSKELEASLPPSLPPSLLLFGQRTAAIPDKMCVKVLSPREGVRACLDVEYAQK